MSEGSYSMCNSELFLIGRIVSETQSQYEYRVQFSRVWIIDSCDRRQAQKVTTLLVVTTYSGSPPNAPPLFLLSPKHELLQINHSTHCFYIAEPHQVEIIVLYSNRVTDTQLLNQPTLRPAARPTNMKKILGKRSSATRQQRHSRMMFSTKEF